jgi:hypothetical protein
MDIGITGTRWGMTDEQKKIAIYIYEKLGGKSLHQGMCEGSDTEMHDMVREKFPDSEIKGHPPINQEAFYAYRVCDQFAPPKDYLVRDRDIVDEVGALIATPKETTEQRRGGTWYTIRYAKKIIKADNGLCKKLYVIKPDGKVDYFDKSNV